MGPGSFPTLVLGTPPLMPWFALVTSLPPACPWPAVITMGTRPSLPRYSQFPSQSTAFLLGTTLSVSCEALLTLTGGRGWQSSQKCGQPSQAAAMDGKAGPCAPDWPLPARSVDGGLCKPVDSPALLQALPYGPRQSETAIWFCCHAMMPVPWRARGSPCISCLCSPVLCQHHDHRGPLRGRDGDRAAVPPPRPRRRQDAQVGASLLLFTTGSQGPSAWVTPQMNYLF